MKQSTEDAITLIMSEVTGSITPEEQKRLNDLKRRYPQVRELYQFLYENPDMDDSSITAPTEAEAFAFVEQLPVREDKRRVLFTPKVWSLAACTLLFIAGICGVWYALIKKPQFNSTTIAAEQKIILRIGGKDYDLTGSKTLSIRSEKQLYLDGNRSLTISPQDWADTVCKIVVPPKMTYFVKLADGTRIFLNSATQLTFPLLFPNDTRTVFISGEAYVKVSANPSRKFVVKLPTSTVEAFGTEFNVSRYRNREDKVALVSGHVHVSDGVHTTQLTPGLEATVSDSIITTDKFDRDEVTSWMKGIIHMPSADDRDIVDAAERYFGQKVIIQRPSNGNRYMIIINRRQPIDSFLDQVPDPKVIIKKDGVIYIK